MSEALDFEKIRRQCEAHARRKGFPQDAEDFAGYVLLDLVEHGRDSVFIERRFIDFLRKHYGRSGTPGGDAKQRARLGSQSVDPETIASDSSGGPSTSEIGVRIALVLGTEKQRDIATDVLANEKKMDAVGADDGISESRVSQIVGCVKKRLEEVVILQERLPEYLDDDERQNLAIRWIEF